MAQSKEAMNGGVEAKKPFYDRRITILCIGTALMDFTSHIASQVRDAQLWLLSRAVGCRGCKAS